MKWYRTTARYPAICTLCVLPIEHGQTIAFRKDGRKTFTKHVTCPRDRDAERIQARAVLAGLGFEARPAPSPGEGIR